MYDILNKQFHSKKALAQSKNYGSIARNSWPHYYWDLHPFNQEYYHELNPFFLCNIQRPDLYQYAKVMTVKDGYLTFAQFLLDHFNHFERIGTELFLIHPDLTPLVPPQLTSYFATWKLVHKKRTSLEKSKKVIIFGTASDEYLGSPDCFEKKLLPLKNLSQETPVEIYLPLRKNVFEKNGKESVLLHQLVDQIKDLLPSKKLKYLTSVDFFNITDFKQNYLLDLGYDNMLVSDNYIDFYMISRGGTTSKIALEDTPKDSVFHFDISPNHEFHVCPLPKTKNLFAEILFYKKRRPLQKDFLFDYGFQSLLREILKKES